MRSEYSECMNMPLSLICGTSRSLPMRILRARERLIAPIRVMVAKSGLTEQQWRILCVLVEQGPMDATRLSEECNLLLPSQTRIVQALVEKGFLERHQDPSDRRRYSLAVTPAGRQVVAVHEDDIMAFSARIEARLGRKRLDKLMELLDELDRI